MYDMYRCADCGKIFKADDAKVIEDLVGEYMGQPAYERWAACPHCNSTDLEEYEPLECWVSYYLNDGTQCYDTLTINGAIGVSMDSEIMAQLKQAYGRRLGEVVDYETVEDMVKED